MLSLLPTSDGASSGASTTGAASFFSCLVRRSLTDPSFVSLPTFNSFFRVFCAGSYGPGVAQVAIRYSWTGGALAPHLTIFEGADQPWTVLLPATSGFVNYTVSSSALAGGSDLQVYFSNRDGALSVSYVSVLVQDPQFPDRVMTCAPLSVDDALAGGVCARTGYWCPGHDSDFTLGFRVSRKYGAPPSDRR